VPHGEPGNHRVSPDQFAEFVAPYQLPLQERFGLNCYGCCEPLESRWHIVKKIPACAGVSVSPWADQEKMAGMLAGTMCIPASPRRPRLPFRHMDEDVARSDLRRTLEITRGASWSSS